MIIPGSGTSSASLWVSGSAGLATAAPIVIVLSGVGAIPLHWVFLLFRFGTPLENGSISQLAVDQHEILMAEPCSAASDRDSERESVAKKSLEGPKGFPLCTCTLHFAADTACTRCSVRKPMGGVHLIC